MSKSITHSSPLAPEPSQRGARAAGMSAAAKWTITAAAVAVMVGGLIVIARPGSAPPAAASGAAAATVTSATATTPASAGQLTAMRPRFNFGTISMAGGKVTHRYAVANGGDTPVVIRKIYTSCMCTTAALVKNGKSSDAFGMPGHTPIPEIDVPLTSQDGAYIEVVFDPAAHGPAGIGTIERVVTVENDAGQPLELQFTATVTP